MTKQEPSSSCEDVVDDLGGRRPRAVAIVGTNASGKSEIGVAVAKALSAEIVSADSRQVYVGFDLCSGKVTAAVADSVPHHLINIVEPPCEFSLFDYLTRARATLQILSGQAILPLVVGGTPLYADALIRGYQLSPNVLDSTERHALEQRDAQELASELNGYFPGEAERVGIRNHRRLVRAVERAREGRSYQEAHKAAPDFDWLIFGVTWEMRLLEQRIQARLKSRLAAGMVEEIAEALRLGIDRDFLWNLGLEYRYIVRFLEGDFANETDFTDALGRAIRRFSKRQMAWYRRWPDVIWLEGSIEERTSGIIRRTRDWTRP